jgi:hypothetical protein
MALPLLLVLASVVAAEAQLRGYNPANSAYERSQDVSMIQLIANPQAWDGKHIRVIGFLRLEFEGDALYLHKEDYVHGIATDAVWIDRPASLTSAQQNAINSDYVICEGIFRAGKHGHMGMFSGTISDINRLEAWSFTRPEK